MQDNNWWLVVGPLHFQSETQTDPPLIKDNFADQLLPSVFTNEDISHIILFHLWKVTLYRLLPYASSSS